MQDIDMAAVTFGRAVAILDMSDRPNERTMAIQIRNLAKWKRASITKQDDVAPDLRYDGAAHNEDNHGL